jgi:hypothetical protein
MKINNTTKGVRLRDERTIGFIRLSSPQVNIGTWYRWMGPDIVLRARVKAFNNFNDLDMRGRIEKTFTEYSLTPYFQFIYNPFRSDTLTVGVGVDFGNR